ncbi:MAG: PIN domain-containing protein [Rhizobiaceae bacterium]
MIGIDTNIVVRLLLRDDEVMFQRAAALVGRTSPDDPLIVNAVVVAESLWVLERKAGVERLTARATLTGLLESEEMRVHETNPFRNWAETLSSEHRDYSDLVIAQINREIGCEFTYTLDGPAAKAVPGMQLLT